MTSSIVIPLTTLIPLINGPLRSIELRPPGRAVVELMLAARAGGRFSPDAIVRFGARLSGRSELTLRRLGPEDMAAVEAALGRPLSAAGRRRGDNPAAARSRLGSLHSEREATNEGD